MTENRDLFNVAEEDMAILNDLAHRKGTVRFLDPRNHIGFDIFREDVDEPAEEGQQNLEKGKADNET
jgi:hypothetical protein